LLVVVANGDVGDRPVALFKLARVAWIFDVIAGRVEEIRKAVGEHFLQRGAQVLRAGIAWIARVSGERLEDVPADDLIRAASCRIEVAVADVQDDKVGTEQSDGAWHALKGSPVVDMRCH